jgi:predicted NUDIX family NTP pyrophosphohydrolase
MASKQSAGILVYRRAAGELQVFLVHPGGPLWAKKDDGAWSIPKGEYDPGEDPLQAAKREFEEETGTAIDGNFTPLAPIRQRSGKTVRVWAIEGDFDAASLKSNLFSLEWPPRSGRMAEFPEVDRGAWFALAAARRKILPGQSGFLDQLSAHLGMPASQPHGEEG